SPARYQPIANLLLYFCYVLKGTDDEKLEKKVRDTVTQRPKLVHQSGWRFIELKAYLLFPGPQSRLTPERRGRLMDMLQLYENASNKNVEAARQLSKIISQDNLEF